MLPPPKETTSLGLGTGVTNPMTRHAAVTASAFSTLQVISNGRAYLGFGRGDSALAHLGYSPASAGAFEDYLSNLKSYLSGEAVDFASDADVDRLHLADRPDASRIQWLQDFPRVPVGVAATGPRVISTAARHADNDVLHYELPDARRAAQLLEMRLSCKAAPQVRWEALGKEARPLSYAEITRAADEVLKDVLIRGDETCVEADIRAMLKERKAIAARLPEEPS